MSGAGFLLDLHRCVGCEACVLACRIENGRTLTAAWRRVLSLNLRRQRSGPTYFLSVACHHCEQPACLIGCPSRAYEQRPDGIVVHHEQSCLGCRYCEMTCPFGTPRFDAEKGVVSKCDLCRHRIDTGLDPACVVACPTEALRYVAASAGPAADAVQFVPGFIDPAGCRPSLRFTTPAGMLRRDLFRHLEEALRR